MTMQSDPYRGFVALSSLIIISYLSTCVKLYSRHYVVAINALAQIYFFTYLPMAFVVPWMFVKYGLRKTLLLAAVLNAAGSIAKYAITLMHGLKAVLYLTIVAQGLVH